VPRFPRLRLITVGAAALSVGMWGTGLGLALSPTTASAGASTTYYFHGAPGDDANRVNGTPTATFDATAPTGSAGATQTTVAGALPGAYWIGTSVPAGSYLTGTITINSYWADANAATIALTGLDVDVKVLTDASVNAAGVTGTVIAQTDPATPANFAVGPTPTLFKLDLTCAAYAANGSCDTPLGGTVVKNLAVVMTPHYIDAGQGAVVAYDSTSSPSSFTVTPGTAPTTTTTTSAPCADALCFSQPLVLPKSGTTGGAADTCFNACGEPSLAVSPVDGKTLYVSTPRTIVVCCNSIPSPVWTSSDDGTTWSNPIFPTGAEHATTGGDTELAVDKRGTVYEGELWLGDDSIYISGDQGKSWDWSPASHDLYDDREWFAYAPGEDALYGVYDGFKGLMVAKAPLSTPLGSHAGQFFPVERLVVPECEVFLVETGVGCKPPVNSVGGTPVIQDSVSPGRPSVAPDGTVYFPFPYQVKDSGIGIAYTSDGAQTFNYSYVKGAGGGVIGDTGNDFPVSAVDSGGRLYVAWIEKKATDGQFQVYLASSADKGATWTTPLKVSQGISKTAVFPNVVAGAPGDVAVSWYGTDVAGDSNSMDANVSWNVYVTQIHDAASATPVLTTGTVETAFHHGVICTQGTGCSGDGRKLLDFFDMKIDGSGNLLVVYTRDHGNAGTEIAFSHQASGCSLTDPGCAPLTAGTTQFPVCALPWLLGGLLTAIAALASRRRVIVLRGVPVTA
jgi:hypothetical protein